MIFSTGLQAHHAEHAPGRLFDGDAAAHREAVQAATLLALRALGVVDARARGLVAQVVLP